jgi:hypothetical protein
VAAVVRIEWTICSSAEAAVELESHLLLEHRPPFNRAGVWKGEPWWLSLTSVNGGLEIILRRTPADGDLGPLPPAFRHTLSLILRATLRLARPDWGLSEFPCGLMRSALHREFCVPTDSPQSLREQLTHSLVSGPAVLVEAFDQLPPGRTEAEREFWMEERDRLTKLRPLVLESVATLADRELKGSHHE